MTKNQFGLLLCCSLLLFFNCTNKQKTRMWARSFPNEGTNSSLHAADLNGDGILDFVIGGGKRLHQSTDKGVIAINGRNGHILWKIATEDQIFGSATFLDITDDGYPDVFIGGRKSTFLAIDGLLGTIIWKYQIPMDTTGSLKTAHFNFYNAQLVPDQNNDGRQDLLVSNGGNVTIPPDVVAGREAGVLLVLDSKTGNVLAAAAMPDGKETYMSPIVLDYDNNGSLDVFFGTGGETISGRFYRTTWQELMLGNIAQAKVLAEGEGHGFIAPPVLTDLNNDGIFDIVVNCHNSTVYAINGKNDNLFWSVSIPDTESNSSLAPGNFNNDGVPDFLLYCMEGKWPENVGGLEIALDGATGKMIRKYQIGCTGFSSPLTADLNNDGYDEVLVSVNEFDCDARNFANMKTRVVVLDIYRDSTGQLGDLFDFKNIATTPWLGDVDKNGFWEMAFCVQMNTSSAIELNGMIVSMIPTKIASTIPPTWGAYMGNKGDGVFINNRK
jgi:outer membrane protein assembly factor BamB